MIYKSYLVEQNINSINQKLSLFYGENLGLKQEFKNIIRSNNTKAEIVSLSQDEILKNEYSFYNELFNISLFNKEKIYFISQCNDKIMDLILKIEAKLDDQKLFIFSEILDKKSKLRKYFEQSKNFSAIACYPDNEMTIKKIILSKLRGFEGLSTQNLNAILESCDNDRLKLSNELSKITSLFSNKKIDNDKLIKLLDIRINDDFNKLKDEALNGDKSKTSKLLSDTVIDPEKSIFYLALINMRLNKLNDINIYSKTSNLENAIDMIRPPIFWKDKPSVIKQARKWNGNKIKKMMNRLYNLEIEIKSNSIINKNVLIKKLIIDICGLANVS